MSNHDRHTGLNSYALRCPSGEYIYDVATKRRGYDHGSAQVFLWTPEEMSSRLAAMNAAMPWAGSLAAVRAR